MTARAGAGPADGATGIEALIVRLLRLGTYVAIGLILVGVVLMAVSGIDPLSAAPRPFDPGSVVADIIGLRAAGFLWLGIVLVIALPVGRVLLELAGAIAHRELPMVAIAIGILIVVGIAIVIALA